MNKYIRTKDKIFKVVDERVFCGTKTYYTGEHIINEKVVLKEADSIKELCDEFVWDKSIIRFEAGSKKYFHYENDDFDFELDKSILKEGIYGAVWCEWGLKYVAKLNGKGELELI